MIPQAARTPGWMRPVFLSALLVTLGTGCTSTYKQTVMVHNSAGPMLRNTSAFISIPVDGRYEKTVYDGSGWQTAAAISAAFSRHLQKTEMAQGVTTFQANLETARSGKFTYLVTPEILHWEDRATEWSGLPDRIQIKIQVVDPATGQTTDGVLIEGKSKWATFGGDHPEDLLAQPIDDYVNGLFGVHAEPETHKAVQHR